MSDRARECLKGASHMPDKRDMHKAKSHRNSKTARQQPTAGRRSEQSPTAASTMTEFVEPTEALAPEMRGKKNKSRR
jgi:hypothetical protein